MVLITSALKTCSFTFAASVVNKKKTQKEKSHFRNLAHASMKVRQEK